MKDDIHNKDQFDIKYYQESLKEIYSDINQNRDFEDLYGYLDRTSGYLGKAILKGADEKERFILPISWLFSISTKLGIDLQDAFLKKYPGICPYCLEAHCVCFKTDKTPLHPIPAYKVKEEMYFKYEALKGSIKVFNLDQAVKNITGIFSVNEVIWYFSGKWHHIAKIHEEIAEIHEAYGSLATKAKPLSAVAEELADVFAWILGAWGILYEEKLDELFIEYYYDGCPVCKAKKCHCGLYNSRIESLIDFKQVELIKNKLSRFSNNYQGGKEVLELLESYNSISESQSIPSAKITLSQTRQVLNDIKMLQHENIELDVLSELNSIVHDVNMLLKLEEYKPAKQIEYQVFLSYSSSNREQARELINILKSKNVNVFFSDEKIMPMDKWKNSIREALQNTKILFLLATPDSLKSEWVTTEWGTAWANDIPVLPILLQCSISDLPDRLRDYQSVNFHEVDKILDALKKYL